MKCEVCGEERFSKHQVIECGIKHILAGQQEIKNRLEKIEGQINCTEESELINWIQTVNSQLENYRKPYMKYMEEKFKNEKPTT